MAELTSTSVFAMETSDYVALDIAKIATAAAAADKDSNSNSSPRVIKSFSRKGSLRLGGENKKPAPAAAVETDTKSGSPINCGAHEGENLAAVTVRMAGPEEPAAVSRVPTPTAAGGAGKQYRRLGSSRRASAPWLDPRRVLFVFATLSSMGTLILLYFTLSMGNMPGGDADAR